MAADNASDQLAAAEVTAPATVAGTTRQHEAERRPTVTIEPTRGWSALNLRELWTYRDLLMILAGNFMEPASVILIFAPIMFPIATALGIHPVHLGIIMTVNMEIGMITPPVGLNLFVTSGIAQLPVTAVIRAAVPWLSVLLTALVIVTYVPWVSLVLLQALD